MKILSLIVLLSLVSACSDTPQETRAKEPPKPPEVITGRQAFQRTFPSARAWAPDARPLLVRSLMIDEAKSGQGKAGAWEVTFVSAERSEARVYTWSSVEDGNLHQGVFPRQPDPWRGPVGQQQPFDVAALKIDTDAALQTATAASSHYLDKPGAKPQVMYLLEDTPRYPDPVWRVLWGATVGSAEYAVTIDASTGKMLQHL